MCLLLRTCPGPFIVCDCTCYSFVHTKQSHSCAACCAHSEFYLFMLRVHQTSTFVRCVMHTRCFPVFIVSIFFSSFFFPSLLYIFFLLRMFDLLKLVFPFCFNIFFSFFSLFSTFVFFFTDVSQFILLFLLHIIFCWPSSTSHRMFCL